MAGHELRILIGLVVAVAAVVGLITRARLHAFLALLLVALALALFAGLSPAKATDALSLGFGQTLGGVGPVLGLGAMLGAMVEASGGAHRLAGGVVRRCGPTGAVWAVAGMAMLVGAPLFFETGVVVMMPLVLAIGTELDRAQSGRSGPGRSGVVRAAVAALAGLSAMHALVPPHPGPLIALEALHAPLGRTFLIGVALALPIVALTGPVYGGWISRFARADPPLAHADGDPAVLSAKGVGAAATLLTLLVPVLLILFKAVADLAWPPAALLRGGADLLGAPAVALLVAVLVGFVTLRGAPGVHLPSRASAGLTAVAGVLLVIGAGGAFKQVLVESGVGPALASLAETAHIPPLAVGWLMAALVRLATGSSTVASVTTAGSMAAAVQAGLHVDPALLTLSIGGGSLFLSHVNDAGFWLVREYVGLSLADTFKTWSAVATMISVATLILLLALAPVL